MNNDLVNSISRFNPVGASSWVQTPAFIAKKKAILNVQNKSDHQCLRWSLLAHKHLQEGWGHLNPTRVECYKPFAEDVNMNGVSEPTDLKEVSEHPCNYFNHRLEFL